MKKAMILFIFLIFLIIKAESGDGDITDLIFQGKCEDDKAKTGACMYHLGNYDSQHHSKYAIFKKCGSGESCSFEEEMCIDNVDQNKRKTGKSCNYDKDCISGSCVSNKCTTNKEGEKCKGNSCERGLYCNYDSTNDNKCVKLAKENEKAEKTSCMPGLGKDKDNKCVKYGTIADKDEIRRTAYLPYYGYDYDYDDYSRLCKSGYSHLKIDTTSTDYIFICDSIETEPECKEDGLVKKDGKWSDGTAITSGCITKEDYKGTKINYSKYSKLKSKLYDDFIKDYNDLDLNKLNSDEKYESWEDGMKSKTREKWFLYNYANELYAAGIIDSEGKAIKDKKCEYEFIKKQLNSNYIKFSTIILAMIALLF